MRKRENQNNLLPAHPKIERKPTLALTTFAASMQQVAGQLKAEKKYPAMHTHTSAMNSFLEFASPAILFGEAFTTGSLKSYQKWLLQRNASWDTVSTYMRRLQATYNRLVPPGSAHHNPQLFDDVYTKVESKTKRALKQEDANTLANTNLQSLPEELQPVLAYFLLMFYFRGMPFIDLAHLRKRDLQDQTIIYCRHKTGRRLTVHIPKYAQALFNKYRDKDPSSLYLFPILNSNISDEWALYRCYQKALRSFNLQLAMLATLLLPGVKLSSYTARHTWATVALHIGMKIGLISQALGHSSIRVTETYFKPFENEKVDEANEDLIRIVVETNHNT